VPEARAARANPLRENIPDSAANAFAMIISLAMFLQMPQLGATARVSLFEVATSADKQGNAPEHPWQGGLINTYPRVWHTCMYVLYVVNMKARIGTLSGDGLPPRSRSGKISVLGQRKIIDFLCVAVFVSVLLWPFSIGLFHYQGLGVRK
jgi:hypothetical protein